MIAHSDLSLRHRDENIFQRYIKIENGIDSLRRIITCFLHTWRQFLNTQGIAHQHFYQNNYSVISSLLIAAYMCRWTGSALVQGNGLSPVRNQCWLIVNWTLWNKLQGNLNRDTNFSLKKMYLKMSSGKWRLFFFRGDKLSLFFFSQCKPVKWKHFPRYWPFVWGIHRSPVNSPHKGQWRGALMFSLICAWIHSWVNNREAGDWRRHRAHYDVTVMTTSWCDVGYPSLWLFR